MYHNEPEYSRGCQAPIPLTDRKNRCEITPTVAALSTLFFLPVLSWEVTPEMEFNFEEAREKWPSDVATLPAKAQIAYAMWMGVTPSAREDAVKARTGFTHPSAP